MRGANATEARIAVDLADDRVEIVDDGIGMDVDGINDYLRVGDRGRKGGAQKVVGKDWYLPGSPEKGARYAESCNRVGGEKNLAQIEVVFVVGTQPPHPSQRIENAMNSVSPGSRILTYELLIGRARTEYVSYLEGAETADRIDRMFN